MPTDVSSAGGEAASRTAAPRWLADEMLGRLARYLRFVGHDTAYARDVPDDRIVEQVQREQRRLLTRDRLLAARVPGAILLRSPEIGEQFRAVHRAAPELPYVPVFTRCTACNGELAPLPKSKERATFRCASCGHDYWEGSHTRSVRIRIAEWLAEP